MSDATPRLVVFEAKATEWEPEAAERELKSEATEGVLCDLGTNLFARAAAGLFIPVGGGAYRVTGQGPQSTSSPRRWVGSLEVAMTASWWRWLELAVKP